jgi:hypothetical protein
MAKTSEQLCLKEEFRSSFDWKRRPLTRDGFREWARGQRQPPIHIGAHRWRPLKDGEPAPRETVEAFSEYISDVLRLGKYPVSAIAVPAQGQPEAAKDSSARLPDVWKVGWLGVFSYIARQFSIADESYCRDEGDIALAARIVLHDVGLREDRSLDAAAAIARAEHLMHRPLDAYARMLLMLWKFDPHTVLFSVHSDKGRAPRRIGVTVSAPLTEAFYGRFRNGEVWDADITETDLARHSCHHHINAVAENRDLDARLAKAQRSMLQLRTHLYQEAALCPPMYKAGTNPRGLAMASSAESRQRLMAFGYRPMGTKTPLTGYDIMEFAPPSLTDRRLEYPSAMSQYWTMKAVLVLYQTNIAAQERLLED